MSEPKPIASQKSKPCTFLLIINYSIIMLLLALNIYIAYYIMISFMGDGFQFMGGLFMGAAYIITIPANIFFFHQVNKINTPNKKPHELFLVSGILFILIGPILHNVTSFWPLFSIYGILIIVASVLCNKRKKKLQLLS